MTARIGFLGPEGTFSHQAVLDASPDGEPVTFATNHEVVMAVQDGRVDLAAAPVESLREGAVAAVLDALAFDAPDVLVVGEQVVAVRHHLIALPGVALEDLTSVTSHPQALAQCAGFLRAVLPDATLVAATSTAAAVHSLAGTGAAIGTTLAAERAGARVVREGIEDDPGNATRFAWLSRSPLDAGVVGSGPWKTSLLFHGAGDATPGWLVRCLSAFAFRGVNLTKIESRPLRSGFGHYLFHLDLDGHRGAEPVAGAIAALEAECEEVRVLGSYPPCPVTGA